MTTPFQLDSWLHTLGGTLQQGHFVNSGADPESTSDLIAPLPHYGFLLTAGPDSTRFLQGQSTCNIDEVSGALARPGAFCSPKGRVVSDFLIARSDNDAYLMRMRRPMVEITQTALSKYIVFSKAEQRDVSGDWIAIGMRGERAMRNIGEVFGNPPDGRYQQQQLLPDGSIAIGIDNEQGLAQCWIKTDRLQLLWPRLSQGLTLCGSRWWELMTIRLGLAEIEPTCSGEFIPQQLNMQFTDAINFQKGCYTGQEVVARMQYKGSVKRRLYRVSYAGKPLPPYTPLYRSGSEQSIGNLVNCAAVDDDLTEALAVITLKDVEAGETIADQNGQSVEVLSLPYAINN